MSEASDTKRVWIGIIAAAILILVGGWLYVQHTQEVTSQATLVPVFKEEREQNRVRAAASSAATPSPSATPQGH